MSSTLFSDAVCECLLNNIEHDPDMLCKVFSIIALEKFSLTGPCKARIMQTNLQSLLRDTANMSTYGLTDPEEIAGITQAKFCAEWSLRNIFRDTAEDSPKMSTDRHQVEGSPSLSQTEYDMSVRDTLPTQTGSKRVATKSFNINVMLNTLDATRHWKVSEDGLSIRNDGSTFESIRATKSVTCGKWFYEVTLVTAGIMQLGWATAHCQFSPEEGTGIGDDVHGFSYDGCRNLIWADGDSEPYGNTDSWKPGDILGFYLDIDNAILECFVNGNSLGSVSPFSKEQFDVQASSGYFPAFSFTSFQQATVNFGATPFKYPPALPWRNLNDHGTISPEMRKAIIRPRSDSVYGAIQLDPLTGLRLPSMQEEAEMDYSSLCTICCDHAATVTLQPCGHNGLCIECAYSLDICPLCRSRIYQRQLFSAEPKDEAAASVVGGLCITGLSSDSSSADTSIPGLSHSSSTSTSAWSAEYYGSSGHRDLSQPSHETTTSSNTISNTAAEDSTAPEPRLRNTTSMASPSTRLALDCLQDPFSPPSTAYFAFLNRPARPARGHMHPLDMDSLDPLEMPISNHRPARFSPPPSSTRLSSELSPTSPTLLPPYPDSFMATRRRSSLGLGPLSSNSDVEMSRSYDSSALSLPPGDPLGSDSDDDDDVVLVESGREASDSEVMEQSAPDFPEGHSFHSRRSSVQFQTSSVSVASLAPQRPLSGSSAYGMPEPEEAFGTVGSIPSVASVSNLSNGVGVQGGGTGRFGARRASMPSNRLEM
ncbi:RING finger and SPRY domain-containing protein 1 [Podila horticola]|nr:RING finger and SPRY domain-containing protein 1 [Podila horticola]